MQIETRKKKTGILNRSVRQLITAVWENEAKANTDKERLSADLMTEVQV